MRILIPSALSAGIVVFLTTLAPTASCQEPLQLIEPAPGHLQAVPIEPAEGASNGYDVDGSDRQDVSDSDPAPVDGGPRPLIGVSHGSVCASGGPHGCLVGVVPGIGTALHGGCPLIGHAARADCIAARWAMSQSWHAGYYHTGWGAPVALIVPPTARMQTRMGWGVSQTTMTPIYHQFKRPYPGAIGAYPMAMPGMPLPLYPTPRWPSHTDQFGVYYVRGPW